MSDNQPKTFNQPKTLYQLACMATDLIYAHLADSHNEAVKFFELDRLCTLIVYHLSDKADCFSEYPSFNKILKPEGEKNANSPNERKNAETEEIAWKIIKK